MQRLLKCARQDETRSRMFTVGSVYVQDESGCVRDNYDHERFIGSGMRFIVQNDIAVGFEYVSVPRFAYFEDLNHV